MIPARGAIVSINDVTFAIIGYITFHEYPSRYILCDHTDILCGIGTPLQTLLSAAELIHRPVFGFISLSQFLITYQYCKASCRVDTPSSWRSKYEHPTSFR